MKVLFLDIDGVVNCVNTTRKSHQGFIPIDPHMAFMVGKIQLDTGCSVVLSSSWRLMKETIPEIESRVVKIDDVTPDSTKGFRGNEIQEWLDFHPEVTRYAILDDNNDFNEGQPLFRTSWQTGITEDIMKLVINYLNETE